MLTQKARYALRAMLYLARMADGVDPPHVATVAEIAEAENIPRKFLEHVLAALKNRDLVVGKRGPKGGYALARAADRITFADILRCIDGPLALAPCASLTSFHPCDDCESFETCLIRPVLLAVRDTTALLLEGISLAEATGKRQISFL
jgi:Rrf2 family protein